MRKIAKYLIALLMILCVVSCKHKITSGTVVDKWYKPQIVIMTPIMCGKTVIMTPQIHPAMWVVVVENDSIKEDFSVSPSQYDSIQIGMFVDFSDR